MHYINSKTSSKVLIVFLMMWMGKFTVAETLTTGSYDVTASMSVNGQLMNNRTDTIACLTHKDAEMMAYDFISKIYQSCQATTTHGRYDINCLDDQNKSMAIAVNEDIENKKFTINIQSSDDMSVVLNGIYRDECGKNVPANVGLETYSLTPGLYHFNVTTKVDSNIVKKSEEKICIKSPQIVIGGIIEKGQKDCKIQIDNQRKDYFAASLTECSDLAVGEKIHFSTMSKEKSLSILFEVTKIENGKEIVVSQFKMGRLLGECK